MGKFHAKKQIYDNIQFDSITEKNYYIYLKDLMKKGQVTEIICHPVYLLQEKYIIHEGKIILSSNDNFEKIRRKYKCKTHQEITYAPDFVVTYKDKHIEAVDVKGKETDVFRIKEKLFNFRYPELELVVVKYDLKTNKFYNIKEYKQLIKDRKKEKTSKEEKKKVKAKSRTKKK